MEQARLAMVHAFDLKYKQQGPSLMPYGLYTIPECAMIGETEIPRNAEAFRMLLDALVTATMPVEALSVMMCLLKFIYASR